MRPRYTHNLLFPMVKPANQIEVPCCTQCYANKARATLCNSTVDSFAVILDAVEGDLIQEIPHGSDIDGIAHKAPSSWQVDVVRKVEVFAESQEFQYLVG